MKPSVLAVRAISAEFVKRTLRPLVIGGVCAVVIFLSIGGWLVTISAWWWLLELVIIVGTLVFMVLAIVAYAAVRLLAPPLTREKRVMTASFVDKLQRVAEVAGISSFSLLYRILLDIFRPKSISYVESVARDSKTLHSDFINLQRHFAD